MRSVFSLKNTILNIFLPCYQNNFVSLFSNVQRFISEYFINCAFHYGILPKLILFIIQFDLQPNFVFSFMGK